MPCAECICCDDLAFGWIALLGRDSDDDDAPTEVFAFCPVCASWEFDLAHATADEYT